MIDLTLAADFDDPTHPGFVARLSRDIGPSNAVLVGEYDETLIFQKDDLTFSLKPPFGEDLIGDVVFIEPGSGRLSRWIRHGSRHNTLLVTERCDQLCIMCSQPPKKTHTDLFSFMEEACMLAPANMMIGFSGGEPLLYKDQLFSLIENVHRVRPDLSFHVLTNGQHINETDVSRLRSEALRAVLWGIPLYSDQAPLHDLIVGKDRAFDQLMKSLPRFARAGAQIELRTVLLKQNYDTLSDLADFISAKLSFISLWAIMQLERIGFAKNRWNEQFVDHSSQPNVLASAISKAKAYGVNATLYNVPHCTVPSNLRSYLSASISDWKRAFPEECANCSVKEVCTGFFEWHSTLKDYQQGGPL